MRVLKGEEQLGEFKGIPVVIDWEYITKHHGVRKEIEIFDRSLGFFLRALAILIIIVLIISGINSGSMMIWDLLDVRNIYGSIFLICFLIFVYAFYLERERDEYYDSIDASLLITLSERIEKSKLKKISLESYLGDHILNILDDNINGTEDDFLKNVLEEIINSKRIEELVSRLGMKKEDFLEIIGRLSLESDLHRDSWINKLLLESFSIALDSYLKKVDEVSVFLYLCKEPLKQILLKRDITQDDIDALRSWVENNAVKEKYRSVFMERAFLKPVSSVNRSYTSRYCPTLEKYSRDYTLEIIKSGFMFSIGRDKEIEKLVELVQQGEASATLVIGAPGVGKTTFLKSLAVKMVVEDVPKPLQDKRLVSFEFNRAFALSKDIGGFKEIVESVLEEVYNAGNVVLLLEDFDQMVNIRNEYSQEVINLIVKGIENYKLRIIASTNPEGFRRHIEPQQGLMSLFNRIEMAEPTDEVAVQILMDEVVRFEKKYKLKIEFDALSKAVLLSHQYQFDRVLPDKALELLEETCSRAQMKGLSFVTEHQVEDIVSEKVGVNIGSISKGESEKLIKLEEQIHKRLIDQDEAVKAVASAMRRARAGLQNSKRPIASFLFFGPTGVGKTELAKALTAEYFGDDKLMIRLDMSEYQEAENLKRLIGEANETEFEGGYLTEAVRAKPYSLILLDEVEKANVRVLDLFLQVLDEGHLTDGFGRKVSFKNTVIIMTSNACSYQIAEMVNKGYKYIDVFRSLSLELRKVFKVEFLNRFDKVIMFKPLRPIELLQVADLMVMKVKGSLADKGIEFIYSEGLLKDIVEEGFDPIYGARELRRVIQDELEDKIAQLIISEELRSGAILEFKSLREYIIN